MPKSEFSISIERLDRFDEAWICGQRPWLEEHLPGQEDLPALSLSQLIVGLVKIDLEHRWRSARSGESSSHDFPSRPHIEDYLPLISKYDLGDPCLGELICEEYQVRCRWGERPSHKEFFDRFPLHLDFLRSALVNLDDEQVRLNSHPNSSPVQRELATTAGAPDAQSTSPWSPTVAAVTAMWQEGCDPVAGYQLVRRLGSGGFGEVWEARGPGGMPVALKRVDLGKSCGDAELASLDLLKRVRHPHLLSVHGYWVIDQTLIIGIELADQSLAAKIDSSQPQSAKGLDLEEVVRYLSDAAEALDYLARPIHRINEQLVRIQHRDVKPANLLLQGGAVKVADFGLAKALEEILDQATISMTLGYAPPEFFHGRTTPNSDQYSLAVSYYQLRTGRLPFNGNQAQIMEGHLQREPDLTGLNDK